MYDAGKILKVGGSPAYQESNATASAQLIDIRAVVKVRRLAPMAYARAFHNSVVLPNGQVVVVGGQSYPIPFNDGTSVLTAELWDPVSETFTRLPAMKVPRNYHSVALLLPDARVLSAGGGLCGQGCAANHADAQIFSPHYLFNADGTPAVRPVITTAPAAVAYGKPMEVRTDGAVAAFSLVRLSSTTHTVNNDQRRVALRFERSGENAYAVSAPTNPGWALPGLYMLFAMNEQGVPSVARTVRLTGEGTPTLAPVDDQFAALGRAVSLKLAGPGGARLDVTGLPAGLSFDASAATISGAPAVPGSFSVTVLATNDVGTTSTDFLWQVDPQGSARFVKLEQLSEIKNNIWGSMAELNLLGPQGETLDRAGWKISASSEERVGEDGSITNAIDGKPGTYWHSRYSSRAATVPHSIVVDLGRAERLGGLRYLPRAGGGNGTMARFRVFVSADGANWGDPVAEGDFRQINASAAAEKTVRFSAGSDAANQAPVLAAQPDMRSLVGERVLLDLVASDDQFEPLAFAATNLPPGLTLRADTGMISGVLQTAGRHAVTVTVSDRQGITASMSFAWQVMDLPPPTPSVAAPVAVAGTATRLVAQLPATLPGLSYAWDFGDGASAPFVPSPETSHVYAAPGIYSVTLQVRGADGQVTVYRFAQAVAGGLATASAPASSSSLGWLPSTDGKTGQLWAVNADADTVSVFDGARLTKLAEIAVGSAPRSLAMLRARRQVWVANRDSASLSVIDADTRQLLRTIALPPASRPWGVVAAARGDRVYVALEGSAKLLQLDAQGAILGELALPGRPRHLSISGDGEQLLAARFISAPQPGEASATVRGERDGAATGGEVWTVSTAPFALVRSMVLRHSLKPDSTVQGRGVPNYLGAPAIAPDGLSAWVPSKQDNIYRGKLRDGQDLDFQNTVRAISSRLSLRDGVEDATARLDHDNSGLASAALFHPTGAYLFIALETSRQVALVDPVGQRELLRVDTGLAPQGLALSGDGSTLFVSNFMQRSVSAYDLAPLLQRGRMALPLRQVIPSVAVEKLPAAVLRGKQLFYDARDPRLARDAYISCASCHSEGSHDGRTWDMTGRGEGLRNTISLIGRAGGQGRLHWSGNFDEVQDFEAQIRTLAGGTGLMTDAQFNAGTRPQPLGTAKAGLSADLDALAAYVQSLDSFPSSPLREADGQLGALARTGRGVFMAQCASCHRGADYTNSAQNLLVDVGTLKPSSGQRLGAPLVGLDIPTLRDAWATAPYLHDGSAATIEDAIRAHVRLPALSAADLASVSAFVGQIGGTEPAWTVRGRYVRFEALSEVRGNPWASMAEFNLLDGWGRAFSRTGWTVQTDSQETGAENGRASNVLDGNVATLWHTAYSAGSAAMPHWIVVDTGALREIAGFRYQPRAGGANGTVNGYRLSVSTDRINWVKVSEGQLSTWGAAADTKTVMLGPTP